MAFGIGNTAAAGTQKKLQFEVARSDISITSYDFVGDKLVFKADMPDEYVGQIAEVALYSLSMSPEVYGSRLISTFDSDEELWMDTTTLVESIYTTANTKIGVDSLSHTPAASATTTSSLGDVFLDLSGYSGNDTFAFAYNVGNSNVNQVVFRFMNDAGNYFSFSLGVQTSGYKIVELLKSSAVATGIPDWSNITEIQVSTTAKSAGAAAINFDAIRVEDVDSLDNDYLMVSRQVLVSEVSKITGQGRSFEYQVAVTF